jgi:hypothetical protein
VLGCLLSLRSFDSSKKLLVHKQASVPITFGGIRFISIATIALVTYLRNWAFITSIIAIRFMVDRNPFLLEALAQVDNNTCIF